MLIRRQKEDNSHVIFDCIQLAFFVVIEQIMNLWAILLLCVVTCSILSYCSCLIYSYCAKLCASTILILSGSQNKTKREKRNNNDLDSLLAYFYQSETQWMQCITLVNGTTLTWFSSSIMSISEWVRQNIIIQIAFHILQL